jgi:hypothetical protein
VSHQEITRCK